MNFKELTPEEKQFYLANVESTLASKKLFLKCNFSLPDLAEETGLELHTLSYLINSQTNHNFKNYINSMRIEYFKEKLNDFEWKDFTVEKMTVACGFKCRATCHRAFIKHVGVPPSAYLKLHRVEYDHRTVPKKRYNFG